MSRYRVSIVIPLYNNVAYTEACLHALAATTPDGLYEVVLVDNGSTDATPALLDSIDGDVQIIRNERNLGFAVASNQGAAAARGRDIVFLNNDTVAQPGWLEPLIAAVDADETVGAVGSRLLYPDGTLQHAGVVTYEHEGAFAIGASHDHHRCPATHPPAMRRQSIDVVTGACMLVRREALEQAGGFDEGYWNGNEDVDLCLTLRAAGWRVIYEPASLLIHHESVSGPERFRLVDQNVERLQQRWAGRYLPPLLVTDWGLARPHPLVHPTVVWITDSGPAVDARIDATVAAALAAVRDEDRVVVDERIIADAEALPPSVRTARSASDGLHDSSHPPSQWRVLTLAPGLLVERETLDQLHSALRIDNRVRRVAPAIGVGAGTSPTGDPARPVYRVVSSLDPRCVLHADLATATEGPGEGAVVVRVETARADLLARSSGVGVARSLVRNGLGL